MRVITGTARGRRLITLAGDTVRPTSSRVKEALFSILQFELEGRRVLDLFAGSGQLGIEALSRGAKSCTFVDASRESLGVTEKNLDSTGLRASAKTVLSDAVAYLDRTDAVYDVVFIDPPYRAGLLPAAMAAAAPHPRRRYGRRDRNRRHARARPAGLCGQTAPLRQNGAHRLQKGGRL